MVNMYSASYFLKAGSEALEKGNLSSSARKRISDILENISEEDNNVIILAPLKYSIKDINPMVHPGTEASRSSI